jgi:hypothetical protein
MEKFILDIDYTEVETKKIRPGFDDIVKKTVHAIKQMAMEISRYEPQQWNTFLEIVLMQCQD